MVCSILTIYMLNFVFWSFNIMKRKPKKQRSIILRLLILGVCAYMTVTLASLWNVLNDSKKEREVLKEQYNQEVNDIEQLRSMLEAESNDKIIEKAARERLGYIYSDEQIFIDISGN